MKVDIEKRKVLKKMVYSAPKLLVLGGLIPTIVHGGSKCSSPPCSNNCNPPQCSGCPQCN